MVREEINKQKYKFNKYSKSYTIRFREEYRKLRKILPYAKIEHVGSSAVKNLGGKGIIDILIAVDKKSKNKAKKQLQNYGYEYTYHPNDSNRMFFKRIIKYSKKERRIHIHLTHYNSHNWKSIIGVRNFLRDDKKTAREYTKVKKCAVKYANGNGKKYRDYKDSYLKKLEKQAISKYFKD